METPKTWKDCVVIARSIYVPPQIIAKTYGIKAEVTEVMEVNRSAISDKGLRLMIDFTDACERGEVSNALAILRKYFERFTQTRSNSKYVFQQAMYLEDEGLASAALMKMILQTPD